jgi:methyltransferase (TIGR00027 family)
MLQQIENVTGTAFVVAEFRAEENHAEYPLYSDHFAHLFLNEGSQRAAARVVAGFPILSEMVKIRTKYFDDVLERQLSSGCRQVVLLGAGLDTRAIRKFAPDVTYFEIDNEATLLLKQSCIEKNNIPANVRFIAGNYETDGLMALLARSGFDPDLRTYIIWEGNTMYLPVESNKAIMEQLRDNLRQFHLSFDYLAMSVIAKSTGEVGLTRLAERFANMGAPWVTGFDDIWALAKDAKLQVIDNFTIGDLYRGYRPFVSQNRPIFGPFYSVCTLGSH